VLCASAAQMISQRSPNVSCTVLAVDSS
jgi:hypothetical protein